jgi:vesicle-associated membrane protein 7
MPIIYCCIALNDKILVDATHRNITGNFQSVSSLLLQNIPDTDSKLSYLYDKYIFHHLVADQIKYLCLTEQSFSRVVAFSFLGEVKQRFATVYSPNTNQNLAKIQPNGLSTDFRTELQRLLLKFNLGDEKYQRLREDLSSIQSVLTENIGKIIQRQDQIALLVDKSQFLDENTAKFKKSATSLRSRMFCENAKIYLIAASIIVVVVYLLLSSSCGFDFAKCTQK